MAAPRLQPISGIMADARDDDNPKVEPQSYGSKEDWVEGTTAQTVGRRPEKESRPDDAFYRSELDADPEAAQESPALTGMEEPRSVTDTAKTPVVGKGGKKVAESNETRQSYFRKRDYD